MTALNERGMVQCELESAGLLLEVLYSSNHVREGDV